MTVLLTAFSSGYGFDRHELYFAMLKPAWGYVDQPPLTPLLAHRLTSLYDGGPWLVRVPATLCAAAWQVHVRHGGCTDSAHRDDRQPEHQVRRRGQQHVSEEPVALCTDPRSLGRSSGTCCTTSTDLAAPPLAWRRDRRLALRHPHPAHRRDAEGYGRGGGR